MANQQQNNQQRPVEGERQNDRSSQSGQSANRTGQQQQQKSDMNKGSTRNSGQFNE